MISELDLKLSAVRLEADGMHLGTGFCVGQNLVVTCAHVVKEFEDVKVYFDGCRFDGTVFRREDSDSVADKLWNTKPKEKSEEETQAITLPDIALIRVPDLTATPLELEESFDAEDTLMAWGFPGIAPAGSSFAGTCEGDHVFGEGGKESQRLIIFRSTQVAPGFSGSPVLNHRTSKVCGMLSWTRHPTHPTGGYAVRAANILKLEEVEEAQRRIETPLRKQLRTYLDGLWSHCARIPDYFPKQLGDFEKIRQRVRIVEDRDSLYTIAEGREQLRAAGQWREEYDPFRSRPEDRGLGRETRQTEPLDWEQVRGEERFRQLVVLGDPGFGKSWLLAYEARRRIQECLNRLESERPRELTIPVLIRLQDLADKVYEKATLRETLDLSLKAREDLYTEELRAYIQEQLQQGRVALLLDAWDEVSDEDRRRVLITQIEVCSRIYTGPMVLTSRPARFNRSPLDKAPVVELLAFERGEIQAFANIWFDSGKASQFTGELDSHPSVNGLAVSR